MTCSILSLDGCLAAFGGWWAGLVPDWVWPLLPYWPWFVGALALGIGYRVAGLPGLVVVSGGIGYLLGRRSVEPVNEHVDGPDALPPVSRPMRAAPNFGAPPHNSAPPSPRDPPRSLTE